MRILILGGNGFIGSAVAALLAQRGHAVTALARDTVTASRRMPQVDWLKAEIATLLTPDRWTPLLARVDAVVNCAGALQDGARDDVAAVQQVAMQALYQASLSSPIRLLVQVSARTDGAAAATPFLSTKRRADTALAASGVPFVILRPAMVIGRNAHGGSALLRALAAFPLATPLIHGDAKIQFAALDDVAAAVADAIDGRIPPRSDVEIASPEVLTLEAAIARHRAWLGLPPAKTVTVPAFLARAATVAADLLGHLGWRSPLRSTAMQAAAGGVLADRPSRSVKSLDETLRNAPAGVQDLWFARLYVLKPPIFATLGLFWFLSGAIALLRFEQAAAYLLAAGIPPSLAAGITLLTSLIDIALGLGVAVRRYAGLCLNGMVMVSAAYLLGATMLEPSLWTDPLGPLVKVLPSIALALTARALLDER